MEPPGSAGILSVRQDGLKSDALNGSQGCRLRTAKMQEGLRRPGPSSFAREVRPPVSTLEETGGQPGAVCRAGGERPALDFCNKPKPVNQPAEGFSAGLASTERGVQEGRVQPVATALPSSSISGDGGLSRCHADLIDNTWSRTIMCSSFDFYRTASPSGLVITKF